MSRWPPRSLAERFWVKVDRSGDGCWLWMAARDRRGYGKFQLGQGLGVSFAHRLAWELSYGPIPEDMEIDHTCFTPACVRPEHLALITPAAHRQQSGERRRLLALSREHCVHGHPFDRVVGSRRRCYPCSKERWTKANRKRASAK